MIMVSWIDLFRFKHIGGCGCNGTDTTKTNMLLWMHLDMHRNKQKHTRGCESSGTHTKHKSYTWMWMSWDRTNQTVHVALSALAQTHANLKCVYECTGTYDSKTYMLMWRLKDRHRYNIHVHRNRHNDCLPVGMDVLEQTQPKHKCECWISVTTLPPTVRALRSHFTCLLLIST